MTDRLDEIERLIAETHRLRSALETKDAQIERLLQEARQLRDREQDLLEQLSRAEAENARLTMRSSVEAPQEGLK